MALTILTSWDSNLRSQDLSVVIKIFMVFELGIRYMYEWRECVGMAMRAGSGRAECKRVWRTLKEHFAVYMQTKVFVKIT